MFQKIDVKKKVDNKLDLGRVVISATRLLGRGEEAPKIELETMDGKEKINNQDLQNKYVLMFFWCMSDSPMVDVMKVVQKTQSEFRDRHNFKLLSVNVDENREEALKYVRDKAIKGWHGYAGSMKHKTVTNFGVPSSPALYLLGDDGNVLMTHSELMQAFYFSKDDFTQMIDDRIAGLEVPPKFKNMNFHPSRN